MLILQNRLPIDEILTGQCAWISSEKAILTSATTGWIAVGAEVTSERQSWYDYFVVKTETGYQLVVDRPASEADANFDTFFPRVERDLELERICLVSDEIMAQLPGFVQIGRNDGRGVSSQAGLASLRGGMNIGGARVTARNVRHGAGGPLGRTSFPGRA